MLAARDYARKYNIKNWATLAEDVLYRIDKIERITSFNRYLTHLSCEDQEAESKYDDSKHLHAWLPERHVRKFIDELNQSNTLYFMKECLYDYDDYEHAILKIFKFDVFYECRHKTFVHPSVKRPFKL